jgi:hypothetical protein
MIALQRGKSVLVHTARLIVNHVGVESQRYAVNFFLPQAVYRQIVRGHLLVFLGNKPRR